MKKEKNEKKIWRIISRNQPQNNDSVYKRCQEALWTLTLTWLILIFDTISWKQNSVHFIYLKEDCVNKPVSLSSACISVLCFAPWLKARQWQWPQLTSSWRKRPWHLFSSCRLFVIIIILDFLRLSFGILLRTVIKHCFLCDQNTSHEHLSAWSRRYLFSIPLAAVIRVRSRGRTLLFHDLWPLLGLNKQPTNTQCFMNIKLLDMFVYTWPSHLHTWRWKHTAVKLISPFTGSKKPGTAPARRCSCE